jgi:hypothetical protein
MKRPSSLKVGTLLVQSYTADDNARRGERAYGIILVNDKVSKYCTLHVLNTHDGRILKEWVKEYSYKDMSKIMKQCHVIF